MPTTLIANATAQAFLAEFETQAAITRRYLERLPEDKLTWKPHEKSLTAGQLALHLALIPADWFALSRTTRRKLPTSHFHSRPRRKKSSMRLTTALPPSASFFPHSTTWQ
jgi:hypothetical protein